MFNLPVYIAIRPVRFLCAAVIILHLLGFLCTLASALWVVWKIVLTGVQIISGLHFVWSQLNSSTVGRWRNLGCSTEGEWFLVDGRGERVNATVEHGTFIHPMFTVVRLRVDGVGGVILSFGAGNTDVHRFRRLRVALRTATERRQRDG